MLTGYESREKGDAESSQPLIWSSTRSDLVQEKNYGHFVAQRTRFISRYTKKSIPVLILGALGAASYRVVFSNSGYSGLETTQSEATRLETIGLETNVLGSATNIPFFNVSDYLATGNATATVQENLAPSRKYITTFPSSGWTNQLMEVTNLIYLASLTNRIPIIPSFEPSHFGSLNDAEPLNFGDVFDVPFLVSKLGFPVVQWHEVKQLDSTVKDQPLEQIGCWSVRAGNQASGGFPGDWTSRSMFKLDISYTPVPHWFTLSHGSNPDTRTWSLWALASLSYRETRARIFGEQSWATLAVPSGSGEKLEPNDQLLCFDDLYYTGLVEPNPGDDFLNDYSPMWNQVGVHMRWKSSFVDLANQYLRRHFGVQNDDPIPSFIIVHVRRDDFGEACSKDVGLDQCFASVKSYKRRVQEVRDTLRSRPGNVNATEVIVTSDERDPKWWDQVSALGPEWRWINHTVERTEERYGKWTPLVLDVMFQSMGAGIVGTKGSTMSGIARKRIQDWHNGTGIDVHWGSPDADKH